jgi:hypothetical protein
MIPATTFGDGPNGGRMHQPTQQVSYSEGLANGNHTQQYISHGQYYTGIVYPQPSYYTVHFPITHFPVVDANSTD